MIYLDTHVVVWLFSGRTELLSPRGERAIFEAVIAEANRLSWTRDPFDRIITAHASLQKAPLLTKDTTISSHYKKAFW